MNLVKPKRLLWSFFLGAFVISLGLVSQSCKYTKSQYRGKKVLHAYLSSDIQSFDPTLITSVNDSQVSSMIFETLLEYDYVKRPVELKPLLVKSLPKVSADKKTFTFELKKGIYYHKHPCFKTSDKTRELVADDVLYSIKRMADKSLKTRGWWVYKGKVKGFDKYRRDLTAAYNRLRNKDQEHFQKLAKEQNRLKPRENLYKSVEVEGLVKLGKYSFEIKLNSPAPRMLFLLAFQKTAIVPPEVAEGCWSEDKWGAGKKINLETLPAGTGPFMLVKNRDGLRITLKRNPSYKHDTYPTKFTAKDRKLGLHKFAGSKLPLADMLEVHIFPGEYQPAYLLFRTGQLDFIPIAGDFWNSAFYKKETKSGKKKVFLKDQMKDFGSFYFQRSVFYYYGFNFKDPVVGNFHKDGTKKSPAEQEKARLLRHALTLAVDFHEANERIHNNLRKIFRGAVPEGWNGYIEKPTKANFKKAKELLAKAGYKDGKHQSGPLKGKPLTLKFTVYKRGSIEQELELMSRQLAKIGVVLKAEVMLFPQLLAKVRSGKVQIFRSGWLADYPDPETFMMIFYGPNGNGGTNGTNFNNKQFNDYYKQIKGMFPSKERAAIYKKMNQIIINQAVFIGSETMIDYFLVNKRIKNYYPSDMAANVWKYYSVPVTK